MSWHPANGLRSWLIQRISAVYLAAYLITVVVAISICFPSTYSQWQSWIAHPVVNVATAIFFISLMFHAWVGIRDVVLDYVSPLIIRFILLVFIVAGYFRRVFCGVGFLFFVIQKSSCSKNLILNVLKEHKKGRKRGLLL